MITIIDLFCTTILNTWFFSSTSTDFSCNRLGIFSTIILTHVTLTHMDSSWFYFISQNISSLETHLNAGYLGFCFTEIFVANSSPFSISKIFQTSSFGIFVVLSNSHGTFVGSECWIEVFKCAFNNDILIMLASTSSNISKALFEFRIIFGALNIFEINGLKWGTTVIGTFISFTNLRIFFVVD